MTEHRQISAQAAPRALQSRSGRVPVKEPTYEADLARRIALVKLILSAMNLVVIVIGNEINPSPSSMELVGSLATGSIFLGYMSLMYLALNRNWISMSYYRVSGPFVDVLFCSLLILGTGGYQSPFNLWLAMALVAAGFSSDQRIVLWATALALLFGTLIAFVPQSVPLDVPIFVIRTAFLLAFGLVIASIANHLARKSAVLAAIDSYAAAADARDSIPDAAAILLDTLNESLKPNAILLELDDGNRFHWGDLSGASVTRDFVVSSGSVRYGVLRLAPSTPVRSDDEQLLHTILDRFCLTLRRISATDELRRSAVQETRLRLADELHDTHVQTLTAIDLQVEGIFGRKRLDSQIATSLLTVRTLARESNARLREFISQGTIDSTDDLGEIITRAKRNWTGTLELKSVDDPLLSRSAWLAIEALIREGLANAQRHGGAHRAWLTLDRRNGAIIVRLQTDGKAPKLPLQRYGYGLTRVSEAVAAAGGQMDFTAGTDEGASLSATFEEMSQ